MKRFWKAVQAEKPYLAVVISVFFFSMIYSYFYSDELYRQLINTPVFQQVLEMVKNTQQNPNFFNIFINIFLNNTQASFILLASGLLFCFFPFTGIIFNGLILGVVLGKATAETGEHPLMVFIKYILPHGIMELPALFLAVAMGIHLGVLVFRTLIYMLRNQREKMMVEWSQLFKRLPIYCLGIVILLFFAAVIESLLILFTI